MAGTAERRIALVTGASRGIGRAIAARLLQDGYFVVGSATSDDGARRIDDDLGDLGGGIVLRVDAEAMVEQGIGDLLERFGAPSVLVNNAGITRDNLLMRMTGTQWSSVVEANLSGLYRVTRPLLRPMMRQRFGRIVNLSSVVARMGNPGQTNYAATKAGIEGFTRALAQEVGSRGITVNAVAPGFIDTDMTRDLAEEQRQAMVDRTAVRRMGAVEDVAAAVSFLASDSAGYITGETLNVNGGLYTA
ncbi:MAG: 3-oxoacyl-ACP reductase FabG [Gammaproteobacteria bacterium]|nr:3-oxoacyl-ACP reductase FabG [Gammaproteobacteria bacterium]